MQVMSPEGLKLLIAREGFETTAYRDTKGIWTIGVGHTAAAGGLVPRAGMVITKAEVDALFAKDIQQYEAAVRKAVKVPLAAHEFDALVSFCFNIGTGGFAGSTVVKRINARDTKAEIVRTWLLWNKPSEIIGRRKSEVNQFYTPYKATLVVVPKVPQKPVVVPPAPTLPKNTDALPEAPKAASGGLFGSIIDRLRAAYPPKAV